MSPVVTVILYIVFVIICILVFGSKGINFTTKLYLDSTTESTSGSEFVKVSAKRNSVTGNYTKTRYYVTFESGINGKRFEYEVSGEQFGLISEGDKGNLTFLGSKFISFDRVIDMTKF